MSKSVLIALGGGGLSAVASLAAQLGLPGAFVLACFAPLPLFTVGLALGPKAAAIAAVAGIAAAMAIAGAAAGGVFAGLHAVPAWLVVRQALLVSGSSGGAAHGASAASTTAPFSGPAADPAGGGRAIGVILASLAVMAAALGCVVAITSSGEGGIEASIRDVLGAAVTATMTSLPAETRDGFVQSAAPYFVGLFGITWQLLIAGNGVLAQKIVSGRGLNARPTPAYSALSLPDWLAWPLVGAAAIALVGSGDVQYLARNVALILAAPYFFLGLAVVHAVARQSRAPGLFLAAFYVTFLVFMVVAGVIVAGVGMIEQWAGLRHRIAPPPVPKE